MFKYQIINHGKENHQYFQGCGVCFSEFDSVVTGCGSDAVEAYEDALECMAQVGIDVAKMPKRPSAIRKTPMCMSVSGTIAEYHYDRSIFPRRIPNDLGVFNYNRRVLSGLVPVFGDLYLDGSPPRQKITPLESTLYGRVGDTTIHPHRPIPRHDNRCND